MGHKMKDSIWKITEDGKSALSVEHSQLAVLQDIRDELKELNGEMRSLNNLLNCPNFLTMPRTLRAIQRNTSKKKRKVAP